MRLARLSSAMLAGAILTVLYAWLVPPMFTPLSYRYQTSQHGPHEARFLSGWRVEQHPRSHTNIIARLKAARAVFDLPPMPTRFPLLLRVNLIPRETCRFTFLLNGQPIGTLENTVRNRGEKFSVTIPHGFARPDRPNQLTILNEAPGESLTEWEWIDLRNYRGALYAPHAYTLVGLEDLAWRWQRLSPTRLLLPALAGTLAWLLSAPLRRMGIWWLINVTVWTAGLVAVAVTTWLRTPLAISPAAFSVWSLGGTVIVGLVRILFWTWVQAVMTTSVLARRWAVQWDRWLQTLPPAIANPLRRCFTELVLTEIALGVILYRAAAAAWRWLRRDPATHTFQCFAGGLVAAAVCLYARWTAVAEGLGNLAFGMLIASLSMAMRRSWPDLRPWAGRR